MSRWKVQRFQLQQKHALKAFERKVLDELGSWHKMACFCALPTFEDCFSRRFNVTNGYNLTIDTGHYEVVCAGIWSKNDLQTAGHGFEGRSDKALFKGWQNKNVSAPQPVS